MSKKSFTRMVLISEKQYETLLSLSNSETQPSSAVDLKLQNTLDYNKKLAEKIKTTNELAEEKRKEGREKPQEFNDTAVALDSTDDNNNDTVVDDDDDDDDISFASAQASHDASFADVLNSSTEGADDSALFEVPEEVIDKCERYFGSAEGRTRANVIGLLQRVFLSGHANFVKPKWLTLGKQLKISLLDFFDVLGLLFSRKKGLRTNNYIKVLQFFQKIDLPLHLFPNTYAKAIIRKADFSLDGPSTKNTTKEQKSRQKAKINNKRRVGARGMAPMLLSPAKWLKNMKEVRQASLEEED